MFILPSLASDVKIEIYGHSPKNLFSYIPAALSAARFLRLVRGLPLSEITVEAPLGEILVLSENNGKCAAFLDKFSVIAEEKTVLSGESVSSKILRSPLGKIRAMNVNSAADFSQRLLSEAALSRKGEDIIGAVAYDSSGGAVYHFSGSGEYPKALTAAVSAASALYPKADTVKVGCDIFDLHFLSGKLTVTDRARTPLIFYSPDT